MKRLLSWASTVFGIAMFFIALGIIRYELRGHTVAQILEAVGSVPMERLFIALLLAMLCYLALTAYDLLAIRSLEAKPRWRSVMLHSFICHAMSINVGCSSLMGGSIRCHYYLRKGVKTSDIVWIVTFCTVTFWLGFLALGGSIFLLMPPNVPALVELPVSTLQLLGALLLLILAAYLFLILVRKTPIIIRGWAIPVIPAHITLAQIAVSASEWILGAAVLYALLPYHPDSLAYLPLLGAYFLAHVSGLVSQVPSGLGVFESILLGLAPPDFDPSQLLASLLLYRLIFNLLPLSVAGILLFIREVRYRRFAHA